MEKAEILVQIHVLGRECKITRIGDICRVDWKDHDSMAPDWDSDLATEFPADRQNMWNQIVLIQASLQMHLHDMIDQYFSTESSK